MKRSFLFLTGPHSPFFAKLGEQLIEAGHRVLRINFTAIDKFFWDGEHTADYKYPLSEFGAYINDVARLRKVTDMVIFGDARQFNQAAIDALKHMKIRLYVFDRGYFGDNWITLEDRVFGSKTVLPKDPRFYLRQAEIPSEPVKKFGNIERAMRLQRIQYKLFGTKSLGFPADASPARTKKVTSDPKLAKGTYFLADYDLSRKASFLRNFVANAPEESILAFYSKKPVSLAQLAKVKEMAAKYNVGDRVEVYAGKAFRPIVKNARAYITNGSREAFTALKKSKPVLCLSNTLYNIEGLTSRLQLADFWKSPSSPDAEIFRQFKSYVIEKTQINGCYYNKQGIEMALDVSLSKILGREVVGNQEALELN